MKSGSTSELFAKSDRLRQVHVGRQFHFTLEPHSFNYVFPIPRLEGMCLADTCFTCFASCAVAGSCIFEEFAAKIDSVCLAYSSSKVGMLDLLYSYSDLYSMLCFSQYGHTTKTLLL